MQRRDVLSLASAALAVAIAGCNHEFEDDDGSGTGGNGGDPNSDDGSDGDGTDGSDGSDDGDGSDGGTDSEQYVDDSGAVPADILWTFYEATETVDVATINEILHSEMPGRALEAQFPGPSPEVVDLETEVLTEGIDEVEYGFAEIPDDEIDILVEATAVYESDGERLTQTDQFVLVTEDGNWKLWDLADRLFQWEQIEVTELIGRLGTEDEIHQIRIGVERAAESAAVDLSGVTIFEFFTSDASATVEVGQHNGESATADTHPDNVQPMVIEHPDIEDQPLDLFGVSVVSAAEPDNILMSGPDDEYQLVVDTSGGENIPPLTAGDSLRVSLATRTGHDTPPIEGEIPPLDEYEAGDELDL